VEGIMTYIALHVEKWLYGSTSIELEHDERACFTNILARAAITGADPPGLIYYFSDQHLANQLHVPLELLERTLEKCKKFKKIRIKTLKRETKHVLSVVNWEKYQHVYLHQREYRKRKKAKKEAQKKALEQGTKKHNGDIIDYDPLGDRIGEDNRGDEIIGDGEDRKVDNETFPSHPKDQFIYILKEFSKEFPYPFDEEADGQVYNYAVEKFRKVDHLRETEKKIEYWKQNPGALRSKGKDPRTQLLEFFEKEAKYLNGENE